MLVRGPSGEIDIGNVHGLWTDGVLGDLLGWSGEVNTIWRGGVRLRLARIEDCYYVPSGMRLDGQPGVAVPTPILRAGRQWKAADQVSLPQRPRGATLGVVQAVTALRPLHSDVSGLGRQAIALGDLVDHAPSGAGDEFGRGKTLGDLLDVVGIVAAAVETTRAQAKALDDLATFLASQGAALWHMRVAVAASAAAVLDTQTTLQPMSTRLIQVATALSVAGAVLDQATKDDLRRIAAQLALAGTRVEAVTMALSSLAPAPTTMTSAAPSLAYSWIDLRDTVTQWAPPLGAVDRDVRQAGTFFRATNRRFTSVDGDALHIVIWSSINDLAERYPELKAQQLGYSRAADRGGPAVWIDRQCFAETKPGCGRLIAHEVGHALTLRHVCLPQLSRELNIDQLVSCESMTTSIVEGCPVTSANLMHPGHREPGLERCQVEQAKREARSRFGR
jgi:hypothetical protein